jgi:hypothetical protein
VKFVRADKYQYALFYSISPVLDKIIPLAVQQIIKLIGIVVMAGDRAGLHTPDPAYGKGLFLVVIQFLTGFHDSPSIE